MLRAMFAVALLCTAFLTVLWGVSAKAHGWYPARCCSNQDCAPVNSEEVEDRGDTFFFTKLNVSFPKNRSEDGRDEDYHICIRQTETGPTVLCVFKPMSGS